MDAGVDDTPALQREPWRRQGLTAYWKEASDEHRDFGVVALGRFLAVERYYETHVSPSANQAGSPGPDWTGGHAAKPSSRSGPRSPARPQHG
jgi:hypothetical protein